MALGYTVTVYRKNLSAQFQPGGQGYRWLDRVRLRMHRDAVNEAPARSGGLARSHRSSIRGLNQYACRATITNVAEHAEWVHGGTEGASADGGFMVLPPGGPGRNTVSRYAGQSFGKKRVRSVAGQDANPWLDRACTKAAMRYGAVPYG